MQLIKQYIVKRNDIINLFCLSFTNGIFFQMFFFYPKELLFSLLISSKKNLELFFYKTNIFFSRVLKKK